MRGSRKRQRSHALTAQSGGAGHEEVREQPGASARRSRPHRERRCGGREGSVCARVIRQRNWCSLEVISARSSNACLSKEFRSGEACGTRRASCQQSVRAPGLRGRRAREENLPTQHEQTTPSSTTAALRAARAVHPGTSVPFGHQGGPKATVPPVRHSDGPLGPHRSPPVAPTPPATPKTADNDGRPSHLLCSAPLRPKGIYPSPPPTAPWRFSSTSFVLRGGFIE